MSHHVMSCHSYKPSNRASFAVHALACLLCGSRLEVARDVGSSQDARSSRKEDAKEDEEGPDARATGCLTTEPWHKVVQYSVTCTHTHTHTYVHTRRETLKDQYTLPTIEPGEGTVLEDINVCLWREENTQVEVTDREKHDNQQAELDL